MPRIKNALQSITAICFFLFTCPAWAGEITVSAAASLTDAFKEIGTAYERHYPDSKVSFNFAASGALLQQIAKGAPVDVFASADQETMNDAEKQGVIAKTNRQNFTRNTLILVVPTSHKGKVKTLQDLTDDSIKRIALGNPDTVPAGRYAKHALETANLWGAIQPKVINTQNVRQSLDYVGREEVDAGFVYATDAKMMKNKVVSAADVTLDTPILYPIASVESSEHAKEAKQFIAFVLSSEGQALLAKYGFLKP